MVRYGVCCDSAIFAKNSVAFRKYVATGAFGSFIPTSSEWYSAVAEFYCFAVVLLRSFIPPAAEFYCFAVVLLRSFIPPAAEFYCFAVLLLRSFIASQFYCYAVLFRLRRSFIASQFYSDFVGVLLLRSCIASQFYSACGGGFGKSILKSLLFPYIMDSEVIVLSDSVLREKAKAFAKKVVFVCRDLKSRHKEFILINQLLRSATSIGANIHEAQYAQSTNDFISKLEIAQKECYETEYWLELLFETGCFPEETYRTLQNECGAIRRMLISSLKTIKTHQKINITAKQ